MDQRRSWQAVQRLDLLAAAWQLSPSEVEQILGVQPGTLDLWRRSVATVWSDELADQVRELESLQYAIWLQQPPGQYAAVWRRPWSNLSPIGAQSPIAAAIAGGRKAVRTMTDFLRAGGD